MMQARVCVEYREGFGVARDTTFHVDIAAAGRYIAEATSERAWDAEGIISIAVDFVSIEE